LPRSGGRACTPSTDRGSACSPTCGTVATLDNVQIDVSRWSGWTTAGKVTTSSGMSSRDSQRLRRQIQLLPRFPARCLCAVRSYVHTSAASTRKAAGLPASAAVSTAVTRMAASRVAVVCGPSRAPPGSIWASERTTGSRTSAGLIHCRASGCDLRQFGSSSAAQSPARLGESLSARETLPVARASNAPMGKGASSGHRVPVVTRAAESKGAEAMAYAAIAQQYAHSYAARALAGCPCAPRSHSQSHALRGSSSQKHVRYSNTNSKFTTQFLTVWQYSAAHRGSIVYM